MQKIKKNCVEKKQVLLLTDLLRNLKILAVDLYLHMALYRFIVIAHHV